MTRALHQGVHAERRSAWEEEHVRRWITKSPSHLLLSQNREPHFQHFHHHLNRAHDQSRRRNRRSGRDTIPNLCVCKLFENAGKIKKDREKREKEEEKGRDTCCFSSHFSLLLLNFAVGRNFHLLPLSSFWSSLMILLPPPSPHVVTVMMMVATLNEYGNPVQHASHITVSKFTCNAWRSKEREREREFTHEFIAITYRHFFICWTPWDMIWAVHSIQFSLYVTNSYTYQVVWGLRWIFKDLYLIKKRIFHP